MKGDEGIKMFEYKKFHMEAVSPGFVTRPWIFLFFRFWLIFIINIDSKVVKKLLTKCKRNSLQLRSYIFEKCGKNLIAPIIKIKV